MEVYVRAPEPLKKTGNLSHNWRMWKTEFIIFLNASGIINKTENEKAYCLLNLIGEVGRETFQTFTFDYPMDKENMTVLLQKFDETFDPPKSNLQKRHEFFTRSKKSNELIEKYISDLQELAKNCNFGELANDLVMNQVILDIKDKELRKKLLNEKNLTLEKLVKIHDLEVSKKAKDFAKTQSESCNASTSKPQKTEEKSSCWRCRETHPFGNCPAWGKVCGKCNERNHLTHCCKGFVNRNTFNNADKSKVNDFKNFNNQFTKPEPKVGHPFNQMKKDAKVNEDSWVKTNTAQQGAHYHAQPSTWNARVEYPATLQTQTNYVAYQEYAPPPSYSACLSNVAAPQFQEQRHGNQPRPATASAATAGNQSKGNQSKGNQKKNLYPPVEHVLKSQYSKQKKKQNEPECVIS